MASLAISQYQEKRVVEPSGESTQYGFFVPFWEPLYSLANDRLAALHSPVGAFAAWKAGLLTEGQYRHALASFEAGAAQVNL